MLGERNSGLVVRCPELWVSCGYDIILEKTLYFHFASRMNKKSTGKMSRKALTEC